MAKINPRRGLNRIYLVMTVIWCLFVLWVPSKTAQDDYNRHESLAKSEFDICNDVRLHGSLFNDQPVRSEQECSNERHVALDKATKEDTYVGTIGGYLQLFWLPVAMVIPPVVLYGILLGLCKLGIWIINGFRF